MRTERAIEHANGALNEAQIWHFTLHWLGINSPPVNRDSIRDLNEKLNNSVGQSSKSSINNFFLSAQRMSFQQDSNRKLSPFDDISIRHGFLILST